MNLPKLIFALIINIIILILYIFLKIKLKNIIFKARDKLFRIFNQKIISTIFYIVFILFNIILFLGKKNKVIALINTYLFLLAFLLETFFELKTYSTSKFAQYKLKYTT